MTSKHIPTAVERVNLSDFLTKDKPAAERGALRAEVVDLRAYIAELESAIAAIQPVAQEPTMAELMPKRAAFIKWCESKSLDVSEDKDAWGKRKFKHSHVQAMWEGWFNAPTATDAAAVRNLALDDAISACEKERVSAHITKCGEDYAYNDAITHCQRAIDSLASSPAKKEGQ